MPRVRAKSLVEKISSKEELLLELKEQQENTSVEDRSFQKSLFLRIRKLELELKVLNSELETELKLQNQRKRLKVFAEHQKAKAKASEKIITMQAAMSLSKINAQRERSEQGLIKAQEKELKAKEKELGSRLLTDEEFEAVKANDPLEAAIYTFRKELKLSREEALITLKRTGQYYELTGESVVSNLNQDDLMDNILGETPEMSEGPDVIEAGANAVDSEANAEGEKDSSSEELDNLLSVAQEEK